MFFFSFIYIYFVRSKQKPTSNCRTFNIGKNYDNKNNSNNAKLFIQRIEESNLKFSIKFALKFLSHSRSQWLCVCVCIMNKQGDAAVMYAVRALCLHYRMPNLICFIYVSSDILGFELPILMLRSICLQLVSSSTPPIHNHFVLVYRSKFFILPTDLYQLNSRDRTRRRQTKRMIKMQIQCI